MSSSSDNSSESPEGASVDIGAQQLGAVYAKALLAAADKAGQADTIVSEMDSLVDDILARLPKLAAVFASPRISADEKKRLLALAFEGRMTPLLLNFLRVTADHGRLDCIRPMRTALRRLYNELRGRVEVLAQTAAPIDPALRQTIVDRLQTALSREIVLQMDVVPELLGGLVVRVGDTVYDGSVANRLKRMRASAVIETGQAIRNSLERFTVSD